MPLPRHIREELELRNAILHEQAERDAFWARVRTALACVFWSCVGLVCMGYGLRTTDPDIGQAAFAAGPVVGYAGILVTLLNAYRRAKERGDL